MGNNFILLTCLKYNYKFSAFLFNFNLTIYFKNYFLIIIEFYILKLIELAFTYRICFYLNF